MDDLLVVQPTIVQSADIHVGQRSWTDHLENTSCLLENLAEPMVPDLVFLRQLSVFGEFFHVS